MHIEGSLATCKGSEGDGSGEERWDVAGRGRMGQRGCRSGGSSGFAPAIAETHSGMGSLQRCKGIYPLFPLKPSNPPCPAEYSEHVLGMACTSGWGIGLGCYMPNKRMGLWFRASQRYQFQSLAYQ